MKYFFTIMAFVISTLFANAGDFIGASDFSVGGIYYAKTSSNTVGVARPSLYGNCYSGSVVIPETVNYGGITYTVTSIEDRAFYNCSSSSLHLIVIPKTVTKIEDEALCSNYDAVVILSEYVEFTYRTYAKKYYVPNVSKFSYKNGSYTNTFSINSISDVYSKDNSASFIYQGTPVKTENIWIKNNLSSFFSISDYEMSDNESNRNVGSYTGVVQIYTSIGFNYTQEFNYNITPAHLTIQITDVSREYGDDNPPLSYSSITGFVNGETLESIGASVELSTSAKKISNVGTYEINSLVLNTNNYSTDSKGVLTIKRAPVTIVCQNANRIYGDSNPNFTYSILGLKNSDTENYAFSIKPAITCDATSKSNVGEYAIKVSGGSASNYDIVQYNNGVLTIAKAPLTLSANSVERIYYSDNPVFDYILSGLVNNDDESCITKAPTYNCSASMSSDCGEYPITPSNAEAKNYEIDYKEGKLTIKKAPLVITANNATKEYGNANPDLTFTAQGLRGEDSLESCMQESPKIATTATVESSVGDYPIIISEGISKNYVLSYNAGKLSITKAPLHLSVLDTTRLYGTNNPKFEFTYEGFKLGDTAATALTQAPTASTTATIKSDVGIYSITAKGGIAKNYEITEYNPGNLIITKAPLTLTATNVERLYYTENPTFDFTLSGLLNNDDKFCITQLPTYNCSATLISDCGNYSIVPLNADAKNYEIAYKEGKLTVTPEALILVASNHCREYGDPNPVLKYDAIGLKGQDNLITALIDEPVLSTTATENSNVGEYPITISGASAKNYKINYRQGILTIGKAPLSVFAESTERMYGDNNPVFVRSYNGFKLNDNEGSSFTSLPKITCSATKTSNVGEYPINVEGGTSRNYTISEYQPGTLTIIKAPLVLTATNKSRLYFENNPQFDFSLTGLKNNDTKSCIVTQPSYTCLADLMSNVGEYAIVPANASAINYQIEYVDGILSINKRNLTASVGNYTRKYNTENPEFDIVYSGFVNNETESVLTEKVNVTCEATRTSDVGTYTITPNGGSAMNYVISQYNNGKLTIEKADQTLTWDQDLSNVELYSQIALNAVSDAGLPVQYEMSPNNVATLYDNAGVWYLDCYGSGAVNIRAVQNGNTNYNAASMISKTLIVSGTGGDPSNPQIYLNVETAGTLPSLIAENRKYQIKNLRLTGNLNGTDINYLREMAGSDSYGNTTAGILETLDISGCTIVSGGRSYYKSYQTSNNKVSDYMFYNCKVLVNLLLPENTSSLGSYSLADCDRLSVLSIPNSITSFGSYAFRNDISLLRVPMPNNLTTIGDMVFYGCNGLSELLIPQKVKSIGDGILNACENISQITVENGNSYFASQNGVLFTSSYDELLIFPVNYNSNQYEIPSGVTRIAPFAFVNAKKLTDVILPETLTSIGTDAFIGCVNLSKLTVAALNPPVCQNDCFDSVSKTRCQLNVPKGCYSYYWVAPVWSEFNHIVEYDNTGIDAISFDDLRVYTVNHNIVIENLPENIVVRVYQLDGTLLFNEKSTGEIISFDLNSDGMYLVVMANKTYKIVLR